MNDFALFDENFNYDSSYLEFEDDDEFVEWYSIEGDERIKELSRQLRSILNYKRSIKFLRFSRSQSFTKTYNINVVNKNELKLNKSTSRLLTLLKMIGVEDGVISEKIQNLIIKFKTDPNEMEIN